MISHDSLSQKIMNMKCPQCNNRIPIADLLHGKKREMPTDVIKISGMKCPACNISLYYTFSKVWLWASTILALLGLSKIGHFQMKYNYVLQIYILIAVFGIMFLSLRLSTTPGSLARIRISKLYLLNFVIYLFLSATFVYLASDIYTTLAPAKSSLVEVVGQVKDISIRNRRFAFITLSSDPHNVKYIVKDKFDSPAAHLQPGARVSLFVEKDPSIAGDSYMVWEVRDGANILLPYEDLKTIRKYEANLNRVPFFRLFIVLLLGFVGSRCLLRKSGISTNEREKDTGEVSSSVSGDIATANQARTWRNLIQKYKPLLIRTYSYKTLCIRSVVLGLAGTILLPYLMWLATVSAYYIDISFGLQLFTTTINLLFFASIILLASLLLSNYYTAAVIAPRREVELVPAGNYAISLLLFLIYCCGIYGSIWCYKRHICRGGHMAHGPYQEWDYIADALWVISLVVSSGGTAWLKKSIGPILLGLAALIIVFRFVFGSRGGIFPFPL